MPWPKGRPRTLEFKNRMREFMRGNKHWVGLIGHEQTPEHRQAVSKGLTGRKLSEDHRKKLSAVRIGNSNARKFPQLNPGMKVCNRCGIEKPLLQFGKNKANKDGKKSYCHPCAYAAKREWEKRNPLKASAQFRRSNLKKYNGMTPEEYQKLWVAQNGLCALCGKPPDEERCMNLCVDHCHKDNRNRALLHGRCNQMIGLAGEDPEILLKAIEYLKKHSPPKQ